MTNPKVLNFATPSSVFQKREGKYVKIKFKIWLSQSTFPLELVDCAHKSLPLTPTCVFATKIPSTALPLTATCVFATKIPSTVPEYLQFPTIPCNCPVDLPLQVLSPVLVFTHTFPCGLVRPARTFPYSVPNCYTYPYPCPLCNG